ncbi:hypothetical protein PROFUN_13619, partial [Planoprotostelium fungivorum]
LQWIETIKRTIARHKRRMLDLSYLQKFKNRTPVVVLVQSLWRRRKACQHIAQLHKVYSRRKKIANEILTTEQSYVGSLQLLVEVYVNPLRKKSPSILSPEDINLIFSTISELAELHEVLLTRLQQRMENWYPRQRIGQLFCDKEFLFKLKMYCSQYVSNYQQSLAALVRLEGENENFSNFLEALLNDPRCRSLTLNDLLIMPVQRIPRYELLLKDLMRFTSQEDDDYPDLDNAAREFKDINSFTNTRTQEANTVRRLRNVQHKVRRVSIKEALLQPGRTLVREGFLVYSSKKRDKMMYGFLFADCLYLSKKTDKKNVSHRYDFKEVIPLEGASVQDITSTPIPSYRTYRTYTDTRLTLSAEASSPPLRKSSATSMKSPVQSTRSVVEKFKLSKSSPENSKIFSASTGSLFKLANKNTPQKEYPHAFSIACVRDGVSITFTFKVEKSNEKKGWVNAINKAILEGESHSVHVLSSQRLRRDIRFTARGRVLFESPRRNGYTPMRIYRGCITSFCGGASRSLGLSSIDIEYYGDRAGNCQMEWIARGRTAHNQERRGSMDNILNSKDESITVKDSDGVFIWVTRTPKALDREDSSSIVMQLPPYLPLYEEDNSDGNSKIMGRECTDIPIFNIRKKRRKKDEVERKFSCPMRCGRAYGTEGALKTHLKNKHKDDPIMHDKISNNIRWPRVSIAQT